jgi:glycerol-3-phosphate acyltransferase PlsY
LIIFCGDSILKGFFPIFVARSIMDFDAVIPSNVFTNNEMYLIPIVLIQIIANNWSIFLKLKGGRGMAVIIGIILGLNPYVAICLYVIYIIAWAKIRDGGPSWILALLVTTLISIPISNVTSICLLACILLTLLKRILGNSITKKYTIIKNRLIFDRDC